MKHFHCPRCGTPFVRVTRHEGAVERVLNRINVFPFRCQLCTTHFHAFWFGSPHATESFDRRQFKRLPTALRAHILADNSEQADNRLLDISMAGCTLETRTALSRGTFLELTITPDCNESDIIVDTAMVCSVRPGLMGMRFLEIEAGAKQRLSQVVLNLLVGHRIPPALDS